MEDRGNVRVANAGRRTRFAQETKPSRFVTEIFFADDFQCHGTSQIDIERFVSDPHRTATQLDRFSIFVGHQLIMLKPMRTRVGVDLSAVCVSAKDSPDSTPSASALRSMHTGQNSTAPENSFPQLGQTRLSSVFMGLTALRMQPGRRKAHESPRRSLPDLTPCGRPPLATVRCTAFATDG